jgi:hypothetical protein
MDYFIDQHIFIVEILIFINECEFIAILNMMLD